MLKVCIKIWVGQDGILAAHYIKVAVAVKLVELLGCASWSILSQYKSISPKRRQASDEMFIFFLILILF